MRALNLNGDLSLLERLHPRWMSLSQLVRVGGTDSQSMHRLAISQKCFY